MNKRCTRLENKNFWDLNPIVYGHEQCEAGCTCSYAPSKLVLIHYVVSGTGTVYVKGTGYPVRPGDAFIRHQFVPISYTADMKSPWQYRWIIFNGNLATRFSQLPVVFRCAKEPFDRMEHVFEFSSMKEEYLASCLFSLYISLFQNEDTENTVMKVKNYLDWNCAEALRIEDLANMLNLDRSYLSRLFRKETGISMKTYLTQAKMNQAMDYLRSSMTVAETAACLGYSDQFIFSKAFKRFFGYPPSKVKKNLE